MNRVLTRLQLRLRAVEVSKDLEVQKWIRRTRQMVESGDIERVLADQPAEPRSLLVKPGAGPS